MPATRALSEVAQLAEPGTVMGGSRVVRQNTVNVPIGGSNPSLPANSKAIGERSEAMVMAALLKSGATLLQPFGDNQRYDLVIDDGGVFKRIQVKTGQVIDGVITCPTCSSYAHRGRESKCYRGQCDLFAIYVPCLNKVYIIPVDDVGIRRVNLRLASARNGQEKGIRWAADYELG